MRKKQRLHFDQVDAVHLTQSGRRVAIRFAMTNETAFEIEISERAARGLCGSLELLLAARVHQAGHWRFLRRAGMR